MKEVPTAGKSMWYSALVSFCFVVSFLLIGCGNKFWDPTQVGRFEPKPSVNAILDSLGVAEETPSAWEGAEQPRPIDVRVLETDYVFSSGDVVRVSVFELLQEGQLFTNDYVVTETGKVSIPEAGVIQTKGLTESQLEQELRDILKPSILKEPLVTVILLRSEQRTFSILGDGVRAPDRYYLPRYGFRLADALAVAGGISEYNVSYIYVSRAVTGEEIKPAPAESKVAEPKQPRTELVVPQQEMMEVIKPRAELQEDKFVITSSEMVRDSELTEVAVPAGIELPVAEVKQYISSSDKSGFGKVDSSKEPAGSEKLEDRAQLQNVRIEWLFQDGKWVPVRVRQGQPGPLEQYETVEPEKVEPLKEKLPPGFEWEQIGTGGVETRVIEIPVDKFQSGDPRYNIVIRSGDSIYVPVDIIGEFYITGNVNRQGAIPLTGRPMTLKMAIAAAGGLGPLAWPQRCEVIRRLGKDREEIVMVDLDKIFSGEQPDFFIKVNDLINVGTHPTSRWRAVLRNAFRLLTGPVGQQSQDAGRSWLAPGVHSYVKILIIGGLFCNLFYHEIESIVQGWFSNPNWSHGILIPFFSLYFVNQRKNEILGQQIKPSYLGLLLLIFCILFYPLNIVHFRYGTLNSLDVIATLGAVVLFLGGWGLVRYLWLPIGFLVFAMPLPGRFYVKFTMPMRLLSARVAGVVLSLVKGLQTTVNGVVIDVVYKGHHLDPPLNVAEACSGMRLLMAFLALGVAMAYLHYRPIWQRIVLLASTIPIAIFCNIVRVTVTGFIYVFYAPEYAQGIYHTFLGLAMLPLAFGLYGFLAWFMSNLFVEQTEAVQDVVLRRPKSDKG